jgi:hypothetical protein
LVLDQVFWLDRPEDQVKDVQYEHVVIVEVGLIGAARYCEEELEVCQGVELEDESRLLASAVGSRCQDCHN